MTTDNSPPIIGVGASAGGLDALEQFFSHIPPDCGIGFVVIQHLDPTHACILPELLQRVTAMKVAEASEGCRVKANCVYVIPSNKELSIDRGRLHVLDPSQPRGFRLPIDAFLTSLARDRREHASGLILSGMGSDGTEGLRAIKENGGLALVQSPESAKFGAMPQSAIDRGLADVVATPDAFWEPLRIWLQRRLIPDPTNADALLPFKSQSALEQIITLLRSHTGNDFSMYKKNTLYRRIERRMGVHQIDDIAHYLRYLHENRQEQDLLFKELLIGVTSFFRDASVWDHLKTQVIPALLAAYPNGRDFRGWVCACSTGEEAYSLAIVFKEVLASAGVEHLYKLQIFATDLDADAIDKARQGFYPAGIAADVSAERLSNFFTAKDDGYFINKTVREMVIFAQQNTITDPPFTKLDLLSCRNLLIYLNSECQKKLIPLFHYALITNGILLLGNAETIGGFNDLFTTLDNPSRIYRRLDQPFSFSDIEFPTKYFPLTTMKHPDSAKPAAVINLQTQVEQLLLEKYSPSAALINDDGDILYIHGRTGKYLEPAAGKANLNIHAMAREGLRHELAAAIKQAKQQSEPVLLTGLTVETNGGSQMINITVQAIERPEVLRGNLMIVFLDVATPKRKKRSRHHLASTELQIVLDELQKAKEENQSLREEAQSSQEELKSANEELQSTNEELQSTNEELTTSKEEMQSLNEELQTVNAELQAKVADLSGVNNDMENLLNSMEIATIFLDNALHVRRFTRHATHLFKLITGDIGRPLSDIVTELDYPELHQDAQDVLRTLVFVEKQVKTHNNCWFKVRIMPYRTQNNVIDGVVITFIDISETKRLEIELRGE